MKEYNDAIQRLEMPERPASTTRSTFPILRKDTPWNYNYIFRNIGNMNISKYSLPQTLLIDNHNQLWIDSRKTEINEHLEEYKDKLEKEFNDLWFEEEDGAEDREEKLNNIENKIKRLNNRIAYYQTELEEFGLVGISIFDFNLDEQFTLAQGNRKSIAVRAINIDTLSYQVDEVTKWDDVQYVYQH